LAFSDQANDLINFPRSGETDRLFSLLPLEKEYNGFVAWPQKLHCKNTEAANFAVP
jgi:hypothetical protein